MEKTMRNKLLLYALISAVGLVLLVMTDHAGISVPLFFVLQFACWYWLAPEKGVMAFCSDIYYFPELIHQRQPHLGKGSMYWSSSLSTALWCW